MMMSTTSQTSLWTPPAYSAPAHPPVYSASGQGTSMQHVPIPNHEEAYCKCNQYQVQMQENPSQGYVFTQTSSTLQGNYAGLPYVPQTSQTAAYQSVYQYAGAQNGHMLHPQSYEVAQTMPKVPYSGYQVLASSQGQDNGLCGKSLGYQSEIAQKKLIQHEPCIHTLTKLEANIQVLKKQSVQQRLEIARLEHSCRRKDTTISILKQQMSWNECKINRLTKDCKEKDISIESLNSENSVETTESKEIETPMPPKEGSLYKENSDVIKKELSRLRLENGDLIRLQAKLCKMELHRDELKHVKEENLSQRHEIARLERRLQTSDDDSAIFSASASDFTPCAESSSC